jgi:hypothetical protein
LISVLRYGDAAFGARGAASLRDLLQRYGLNPEAVAAGEPINGSYWGESEAGLVGQNLLYRDDTPLHSVLHEASHFVCMTSARRANLERDAGGDDAEENGVCYLQIVLADYVANFGQARALADMDAWGYTFRLGSAARWFQEDAKDARIWLQTHAVLDEVGRPTFRCRE